MDETRTELKILPLSSLKPHEETDAGLLARLARRMRADSVQGDPLIVDGESGTILDGMHRFGALKSLRVGNAVCHVVDYQSPDVKLARWLRVVEKPEERLFLALREEMRLEVSEGAEGGGGLVFLYRGARYAVGGLPQAGPNHEAVKRFDEIARSLNVRVWFMDEASIGQVSKDSLVVLTPPVTKAQVVESAGRGVLFPAKSTLHEFPLRVLRVNYPIGALSRGEDRLEEVLLKCSPKVLEAPAEVAGRRYREKVAILR